MNCYFLTGATGAVGSYVLQHLLQHSQSHVYVLVRADSDESAGQRTKHVLESVLGGDSSACAHRVTTICGDTQLPMFGMPRSLYERVAGNCTHVIHTAGLVRMNLPLEKARDSAVGSAENIVAFARALQQHGQLRKVEFVSTVGVGGRMKDVPEDWIETPRKFHNTYEQAKAEAEVRIRAAITDGIPITVHRPSMVVGNSYNGHTLHFQVFYFLIEFLAGRRTRGIFPDFGSTRLDIVPVDFVAEAIVRSSELIDSTGKVLHLCGGPDDAIGLRELQAIVHRSLAARGEHVPQPRYAPRWLFRRMAQALQAFVDENSRRALATLPVFLDYLDSDQTFHNDRTRNWLRDAGIAAPRAKEYLPRVLDFYFSAVHRTRGSVQSE